MVNPLWPGTSNQVPVAYALLVVVPSSVTRQAPVTISIRSGAPLFPRRPLKMIEGVDPDRGSLPSTVS